MCLNTVGVLDGLIYVLRSILRRRRERRRRRRSGARGQRAPARGRFERVKYEERYCLTYENGDKK